jgi:hypothetical protein
MTKPHFPPASIDWRQAGKYPPTRNLTTKIRPLHEFPVSIQL